MGVRETAWLAVRDGIAAELDLALELLSAWTREPSANLRRFASEATRPRGVWCRHLTMLRRNPRPALPLILEPLRADPSKYVRDSVANWLNDASKDHPDWVRETCERWRLESPVPATEGIIRRALRTLRSALEKESA
jgi:3-methyladenine DNA glycosylase AlkC